jgi:hypothetical protein
MAPKHDALVEENRHLYAENDALRAEIVTLKWNLENCEMIRQEQASGSNLTLGALV